MSACRFRRSALFALTLSAGLLAASEAAAAQAPRLDRREAVRQEPPISLWTRDVTGFFGGVRAKHGSRPHPPGPETKPGNSNAKPEGPGLCPFGGVSNPGGGN
jgi:hypothetical protein